MNDDFRRGAYLSAGLHIGIVALTLSGALGTTSLSMPPERIYTATLEGGTRLGGITQVARDDKTKSEEAPPKAVSAPKEAPAPTREREKTKQKEEAPAPGDLIIPDKRPTAAPKSRATPAPKATKAPAKPKEPTLEEINRQLRQATQRYTGDSANAGGRGFGAAAVGGKGMGGGVLLPREVLLYVRVLQGRIREGWRWFDRSESLSADVFIELNAQGEVTNLDVRRSSGNAAFDDSVVRAIRKANPLPAPPPSVFAFIQRERGVLIRFDPSEAG